MAVEKRPKEPQIIELEKEIDDIQARLFADTLRAQAKADKTRCPTCGQRRRVHEPQEEL